MSEASILYSLVTAFFTKHLVAERMLSPHTISAYRDTLKLFLVHAASAAGKGPEELELGDLGYEEVLAFLNDLEAKRKNVTRTRNARLAALRTFFRYVLLRDPSHGLLCHQVLSIAAKRHVERIVGYLSEEELASILGSVDRTTRSGRRDYLLIALIYDTSGRVQEVLDLRPRDFHLGRPAFVRVIGKGRQERLTPLLPATARLVKHYLAEEGYDSKPDELLFKNHSGRVLTRFGARYLLGKYVAEAARHLPGLAKTRVSPHVLRHTKAMHLLESGVGIESIKEILGHRDISSTEVYVTASLGMKRAALEQAGSGILRGPRTRPVSPSLLAWLETL